MFDAARAPNEILEVNAREPSLDLHPRHAGDLHVITLCSVDADPTRLQHTRREPRLDEHDATGRQVIPEALECAPDVRERADVTNGAEQTLDDVVLVRQRKRGHVAYVDGAGVKLSLSDAHERRIEIQTVDLEAVSLVEQPRMLARTTSDVEHRAGTRVLAPDQRRERHGLGFV